MSIIMYDSIDVAVLPSGDYAYAGYVGGRWPTYDALKTKFPKAHVLSIAISAGEVADCLDVETGDATISQAAVWVLDRIKAGVFRPCIYASVSQMAPVIAAVHAVLPAEALAQVRLWTAHYGVGSHICGPSTCRQLAVSADGTQWTDSARGISLDESILKDDFFGAAPVASPVADPEVSKWEVTMMNVLPVKKLGDKDSSEPWFVRRIQGLCAALLPGEPIAIDGDFGTMTEAAVKQLQASHHATVDGIVGPATWAILVTGSA